VNLIKKAVASFDNKLNGIFLSFRHLQGLIFVKTGQSFRSFWGGVYFTKPNSAIQKTARLIYSLSQVDEVQKNAQKP
jgi:hypothetical protein